ncbi:MAG: chemotaxis protein CheC [Epsilonproteobacteria bacterium]|nr:chemotaxis protein CheC [Campylobacterota bacterium]
MTQHSFNAQQEDVLKELINVSFGLSASLIGDMLDNHARLHIPEISSIVIEELNDKIIEVLEEKYDFYLTKQRFLGSFNGEVLFVFNTYSARAFSNLLLQQEVMDEGDIKASILELTNIITSACIGKFCEIIDGETIFKVPSIEKREIARMETYDKIEGYENVIVIKTALDIEKENILGHMFILLNNQMLEQLKRTIDKL